MASFFNMKGTTNDSFQLGIRGPILKRSTNILTLPESDSDGYVLATKIYLGSSKAASYITSSDYTGNSATATKLYTARKISLSGAVTGETNTTNLFDGSKNITITTTAVDSDKITWNTSATNKVPKTSIEENAFADFTHNHDDSYLKLSGGLVTGDIYIGGTTSSASASHQIKFVNSAATDAPYATISADSSKVLTVNSGILFDSGSTTHILRSSTATNGSLGNSSYPWATIYGTTIYENGTSLSNKYLGKTAKASDSALLDGKAPSYYLDYNNLTDTPDIPTVHNTEIVIQKNGTKVDSFTLNQSSTKNINITVPTTVAELTDNSNYQLKSERVTIVSSSSTDSQYPTAKAVYGFVNTNYSPKAGSSSLTTYSGGTFGTAAAKGIVDSKDGITSSATDLTSGKAVYEYVNDKIKNVYVFKGTVANVTTADNGHITPVQTATDSTIEKVNGYVYNITNSFVYKGETYPAGTNIVYEDETDNNNPNDGEWKPLGGSFDIDLGNYQEKDADLTAIAGLTGTSGFLKKTAANTWSLDNTSYAPATNNIANQAAAITVSAGTANITRYIYFADSAATDTIGKIAYSGKLKYNPVSDILTVGSISGNAATATAWATDSTITIGSAAAKNLNAGSALSWSLADIGAAATSHTHGNITSSGTLQSSDITIADGDKLVVTDASNSSKVARTSIAFDASTDSQYLSKKGTWESVDKLIGSYTGTVTSVGISSGTGISVSGGPVTTSGTFTITNTGVTKLGTRTGDITIANLKTDLSLGSMAYEASTDYLPLDLTGGYTLSGGKLTISTAGETYPLRISGDGNSFYNEFSFKTETIGTTSVKAGKLTLNDSSTDAAQMFEVKAGSHIGTLKLETNTTGTTLAIKHDSGAYVNVLTGTLGKLNTTSTTSLDTNANESFSGTINLHKISKTGKYSDLIGTPSLATVATSGSYNDLLNKPSIPTTASDINAVPNTRKVNNKALSADITLTGEDIKTKSTASTTIATDLSNLQTAIDGKTAVTVNNVVQSTWNADTKVNSITTADNNTRVYVVTNGTNGSYILAVNPNASTIPVRYTDGRLKVGTPVEEYDAANKKYVDEHRVKIEYWG